MDAKAWAELIKAVAELLWPVFAIGVLWVARPFIQRMLQRDNIKIKVGDYELSIGEATANMGSAITDIQAKLAEMSEHLDGLKGKEGAQALLQDKAISDEAGAERMPELARPMPEAEPPARPRAESVPPARTETTRIEPTGSEPASLRILWVDDVPSHNAFLADRLRGMGHEVDTSLGTADALSRLKAVQYDCLISDLGRRENGVNNSMAGLQLIERVREGGNEIPILIFASSRAKALEGRLTAAGATRVTNSGIDVLAFVDACAARARTS